MPALPVTKRPLCPYVIVMSCAILEERSATRLVRSLHRVPTPPGKSWKVLEFFLENSRTWKVLENHFFVLESPGN